MGISGGRCRRYQQHRPRGPAIDVFNFGGGRCRTYRQHPLGPHHRCLQLRWWMLSDLPLTPPQRPYHRRLQLPDLLGVRRQRFFASMVDAPGPLAPAHPEGPPSMFLCVDGGLCWTSSSDTSRGPTVDCRVKSSR
jgi:hypothetical protein